MENYSSNFELDEYYNILYFNGEEYSGGCIDIDENRVILINGVNRFELFYKNIKDIKKNNNSKVKGVSKDEPIVTNEQGGKQSKSLYRLDLVPPLALLKVGEELSKGLEHYPPDNWKLISIEDHLNHALIHLYAWIAGDKSDDHLSHATCRLLFATDLEEKNKQ